MLPLPSWIQSHAAAHGEGCGAAGSGCVRALPLGGVGPAGLQPAGRQSATAHGHHLAQPLSVQRCPSSALASSCALAYCRKLHGACPS
jgi:hypothetical protein